MAKDNSVKKYIRFKFRDLGIIETPENALACIKAGYFNEFEQEDVYLTEEEFNAIPQCGGSLNIKEMMMKDDLFADRGEGCE